MTLWFHPTAGSDTAGDGTSGNPYKTPKGAIDWLKVNGLNGNVVIQAQAPGKIRTDFSINGLLPGQNGNPEQLKILGATSFDNVKSYPWSPTAGKTAITLGRQAAAWIEGFFFDYTDAFNESGIGSSRIAVNTGSRSCVWMKDCGFGFNEWSAGYVNAQEQCDFQYFGDLLIDVPNATATGTLSTTSNVISIFGLSGLLPLIPGCGVSGTGIPPATFVQAVNGSQITLGNSYADLTQPAMPTIDGQSALTFHCGISAPFGIGQTSILLNANFNKPGGGVTYIRGAPHFLFGLLFADESAHINWGSLCINPDTKTVKTVTGAAGNPVVTITGPNPNGIAVGFYAHAAQVPFGARVTAINGSDITLDKALTAAPSTVIFGNRPKVVGPQLTRWCSVIKPPGWPATDHLPGEPYVVSSTHGRGRLYSDYLV